MSSDSTSAPAGRRRRDAGATKQALLEAAQARFAQVGYESTTLRDVAADVGVNLALIKRYFGSKEGLFKAALAASPRLMNDVPAGRASLAEALSRQLATDSWPEFDKHPVLMLLRASGDEQVTALRREALEGAAQRILDALGTGSSPADRSADGLLRAELLVALGVGVAVLRSAVGLEPLASVSAEELAGPIQGIVDGLMA
ncbi:TetR family transcriptional regulator [Actinoplanes lobatus]|uniref:AcrR family transcriptional regulator n=1 Tax=Actinoplanes lobatus TaxID=113568 RepID=A0A7W7HKL4_9ACTN|nr:TetR/AcrR family transcriptional regulator [Actinoplanes lobatus]MBB4751927.1 AcrR family transcriptional regulator [Actinoplanes lobatus]GGN85510.1 TetR family transcriptional regulator [Actinoplanes lobatus]GIE44346.1 TetR family transcriptional regulator [Actinoplanes lobatus]